MKLWRVTIDLPPPPGKRKGWQHVYAVLADNKVNAEVRAVDWFWPDPDDREHLPPGTLVKAEEDEDGIMKAGTYRT